MTNQFQHQIYKVLTVDLQRTLLVHYAEITRNLVFYNSSIEVGALPDPQDGLSSLFQLFALSDGEGAVAGTSSVEMSSRWNSWKLANRCNIAAAVAT
jgi:hypothetical protein